MSSKKSEPTTANPAKTNREEDSPSGRLELLEGVRALVGRVNKGDKQALPQLREALDQLPKLASILVDPAAQAEWSLIRNYAGEDLLVEETLPRTLKQMRAELAGPDPSPLEHLLVERVVATWFQLQYFESLYAQNLRGMTIVQSDYYQRRIDRAHKRHLSAVRTLAQVRKLLKPAVAQINIAEQQVNMAGSPTSETSGQVRSRRS